ncbi:F-box/LRR-repeat protein [Megavirus baoshan]|uniref:Putative F-box/LRR-repeat protein n=1 Tax=Megavirus baoshan TaxID=2496520 RepID=A0A3S8UWV4_9VIRU|nr:F-box/LRR-repeat protein [Megavirus baoshan]AZL89199.1 F-box/LRR-repeat protein [Megavirus baoshan]
MLLNLPHDLLFKIVLYFDDYHIFDLLQICKDIRFVIFDMINRYPKNFKFDFSYHCIIQKRLIVCQNIKSINLSRTNITDKELKLLHGITKINLSCCKNITGSGFKYLQLVENLNLSGNKKIICSELRHLSNIVKINLSMTNIDDQAIEYLIFGQNIDDNNNFKIQPQTKIKFIDLSFTKITNCTISYLSNVETMNINSCEFVTSSCLQYLQNITHIYMNTYNVLIGDNIKYLKKIKLLVLNDHTLSDNQLEYIQNIEHLEIYNASDKITCQGLQKLNNLKILSLRHSCDIDTISFIPTNQIRTLDLKNCHQVTDSSLQYLPHLQTINLSWCYKITDNGLKNLQHVKNINLSGCYRITDNGLIYLNNANRINISYCIKITDTGLKHLQNVKNIKLGYHSKSDIIGIEYFDCDYSKEKYLKEIKNTKQLITDIGLSYLINTQTLSLLYCENITDDGLQYLSKIKSISINNCPKINGIGLKYLSDCQKINLYNVRLCRSNLKYLSLFSKITTNNNFTDYDLEYLSQAKKIILSGFNKISVNGLQHLYKVDKLFIQKPMSYSI